MQVRQLCPKMAGDHADKKKMPAFLEEYVDFCNDHIYRQDKGLKEETNFIHYQAARRPNATRSPRRKLGDVAVLSDAIQFCSQKINPEVFTTDAYQKHRDFVTMYFNPPYPHALAVNFGFPEG